MHVANAMVDNNMIIDSVQVVDVGLRLPLSELL